MILLVSKGLWYFSDMVGCHIEDWLCGVAALCRWVRVEGRRCSFVEVGAY